MNEKFKCPLQVAYKKILGEEHYQDYYNSNCFDCRNNREPADKTFEENTADLAITFKVMELMNDLDKLEKMTKKEIFDTVAKTSGMYN